MTSIGEVPVTALDGALSGGPSTRRMLRGRVSRVPLWVGLFIVAGVALLSFVAPWLPLPNPNKVNLGESLLSPSLGHLFGTDALGRDMLSRVVYAGQVDLLLGISTTYVSLAIGIVAGAFAGYYRGRREALVMRLVDTLIAFPFLVLVLAIIAIVGPGLVGIYVGIVVVSWTVYARITYSGMLVLRERQFILAARTLGFRDARVILRHALPNLIRPNLVFSLSDLVLNILALASLSFLGVGVQPPTPEWGSLIAGGQNYLLSAWWITTLPGLVVVVVAVGFSLLGEGLADWLSVDSARAA